MPHPVSDHIDRAISLLDPTSFRAVNEALTDLLTELHDDATQDGATRTIDKVERIARELGIDITHQDA